MFINGKEYGPYAVVYSHKFISDTEYLYHANEVEIPTEDEWTFETDVYINGKKYPNVSNIERSNKGLEAKVIRDNSKKQYFVKCNNKKFGPYDEDIYQLDFLSDGKTLVYKAKKKSKRLPCYKRKGNRTF